MDFAVSFSESVTNLSTDDFTLVTTGTAAGSIASVSAATGSSITVTVNSITGTGTLKLNLNGSTNVADDAGNGVAAYSSGSTHSVDRDAPAAPSTPDLDDASDTGASNTDNITSDNTPTFNGTAEANATVTVISSISGTLGTTTADGSGNWTYTASAMANGVHNMTATATDAAGNTSVASSALAVTIDGPVTVTTNADSGADATIDGSLAVDIADGSGLSLREAMAYVTANGKIDFAAGLSGTTITLGAPLSVPSNITLDADALGTATITGSTFTPSGSLTITNGSGDSLTLESELTGANSLTKTGAGRLILTNTNNSTSYSGGVTVMTGELSIGSDDVFSSGTLTLNGGTLTNNSASFTLDNDIVLGASGGTVQVVGAGQTVTLSGGISGTGALSKTSGGTLTLSGSNSFSGGLSISGTNGVTANDSSNLGAGAVTFNTTSLLTLTGTAQTITNAIVLANDATISNANAMTISGVISGTGALTKAGAGTLTLSGSNTATGAVSISAGGLALAGGSALVDSVAVSVGAGANLILPSGSETIGSIAGAGNLVLTGGTLTTGANNSSTSLSGVISGAGNLTKAGTGTLTLSGFSTFTGATQVSAGTLLITGNLSSSSGVSVASGATLSGTGTVAAVSVANGGYLSPGNAGPGLISIAGNLLLNSGGNLLLDITGTTAATQYDQLNVNGTVTLTGATISATHSYVAANGDTYEVITNDGADAITGTFSGIAEGESFVAGGNSSNLLVSYVAGSGNDLSLTNNLLPGSPTGVSAVAGVSSATITFSSPTVTGGSAITEYSVTSSPGGIVQAGASSPITVPNLVNGTEYTFTVTAKNSSGIGNASSPSNPVTPRGTQTITFDDPGTQNFGTSPTLTAMTSALGLTPTFTSSTAGVCTITSGGNLTFVTVGICTINADQSGNASYLPATQVSRSFTVNAVVPGAPVIGTATAGDAQASVSFTAPGFSGGTAITGYTLVSTPGGITASGASSPITITGLTNGISYSFTVVAANSVGTGGASAASNVVKPNGAPIITSTAITNATQDIVYSYTFVARDSDVGGSIMLSAVTLPSWLSFNSSTGVLSGTPSNANLGSHAVVLRATDVDGLTAEQSFMIVVTKVNGAPVITSTALTSATQDAVYSYTLVATDSDVGDSLTLSAVTLPSWLSFNAATGVLSGTPSNANLGSHAVVLRATDVDGLTAEQSFMIVVTKVNGAPVITSTALTSATQDAAYSYTLVATDSDVGDSLTLSAVTLPSWLSFNAATGVLSGTPTNANVGSHAVVLRATDGDGLTIDQSFTIVVANVNDAPVATNQTVTLEEDSSLMITLAAEDVDNDPLTYEITAQPASGTLEQHGSVWLYTPEKDFNGTDSVSFIAKDAELSSEPATVTITVTPVNDDPQAVDDSYNLTSTPNDTYSLAVLANDVDVDGDTLTIDGAAADIGSVQITSDGLSFTAPEAYVGPVALRYTINDGNKGRATAKVNVLIEGADSANQPVITLPDDVEVNATGLFTRVKLGFAKAVDRNGHPLPVSLVNKSLFFAPGNYLAYWQAVDGEGNKAIKAQKVKVNPLISLSKDQVVGEGNQVTVSVHLNGEAPNYPLSIPYTVSGSADSSDHDLVDGVVEITSGQMAEIHFTTLNDGVTEGNEEVLISLDSSLNLGSKQQTQVVITEANIAPQVSLAVTQAGQQQVIVAQNGGDVHIRASASDANEQDTLTLTWASGTLSLQADATGMTFSPAAVSPGIYPVSLTVTDDGSPVLSSTETVYIVVRPSLAALTSADTDGDLIPDDQEGYSDSDRDGIPDYLDANNDCNVMPEGELQPVYFLAEGQAGVCLRLGNIALSRGQSGVQLQPEAVAEDALAANVGGIFDFIATGLPQLGQSYSLVLPQRSPVPANAVYRKFNAQAGWRDFVIDANNTVASTEGERGFCPPPGDSRWTLGLTEGHWCVQLTIEDGGPNDDDGVANRTIVDPSGVAVMLNGNHLPVANPDSAAIAWNQSIDVNVLANDTDSDGDSLSVNQVISEFGTVTVLADQRISYTPAADFIGTDVLVYSITDGKGGTASSELTIVVNGNTAPVTVDDSAATDDRTSLLIDVLSNDTDVDGNTLTLLSATAQQGTVTIEANKLRYIPKTGFDGVDTVTYRISDGQGGEATGQVLITVKAYQEVIIDNKSGGGSMTLWALAFILVCAMLRRRELQRLALGCLLLLSVTQQAQATDWYVEGFIGQAQADKTLPELNTQVGEGQLLNVDDSDTAFGVSLGYQWTPTVALELGYADFGEGSARIKGATLTPEQYHELVKAVTPVLADGVTLGLRFTLLQHQGWRFEVPVGLFHWQADISSTMGNTTIKTDLDGTDWYAGVRFSYQFSDAWSVGLGYQYIDIEPNDLLSYQLNLRYQF
ncbi:hypothetical protein CBX96_09840 [Shewanella sp. BC20]|nr:hypothetical protein CBX96_09840 [Shewanella sp. BC20]